MPEGDAVRRTARRLDEALARQVLTRAELRVPRFSTVDLRGLTVLGTHVVGKHLLTRLSGRGREVTLHSHLLLDGSWRTGPLGPVRAPQHEVRAVLATTDHQAVGVRVHRISVRPTAQEHEWIGHLGPDIMGEHFEVDVAAARLVGLTGPVGEPRGLVEVLLDQTLVCGLGTMWASELAATIRRDPFTPASSLHVPDVAPGLAAIRGRMLRALDAPELIRRRELLVFERAGQPCRRCGGPIRRGRVGVAPMERPTYWCPRCQP